jgi:hypothetical protein
VAVAVTTTLAKGYDLEYIWKQVDRSPPRAQPGITSRPANRRGTARPLGR